MALTGCGLFLFVLTHMLGNLQIFLGPEALNRYGHFLQSTPEILWPARLGLLLILVVHVWSAVRITLENRAARPVAYAQYEAVAASYASRTMIWSGLIVTAFLVYHLLHFTLGVTHPDHYAVFDAQGRHDVYRMVVRGFQQPLVSGFYVLAMSLLCLHLSHGVSSMFQSLGWKSETYCCAIDCFAKGTAALIFIGNCSIPLAVLTGIVK